MLTLRDLIVPLESEHNTALRALLKIRSNCIQERSFGNVQVMAYPSLYCISSTKRRPSGPFKLKVNHLNSLLEEEYQNAQRAYRN